MAQGGVSGGLRKHFPENLPAAGAAGTALGPLPGKQVPGERHPPGSVFCLSSRWLFLAPFLLHLLLLILLPASPYDFPPTPEIPDPAATLGGGADAGGSSPRWSHPLSVGCIVVDTTLPWGEVTVPKPPTPQLGAVCHPGKLRQPQVGTRPCSEG